MTYAEQNATASQTLAAPDDEAAVRRLVAEADAYQSDVEQFLALHTAEVVLVNIAGRRVLGRDTLEQAMRQALASPLAKVFTSLEVEDVRFIRPDVAIVSCLKQVSDERDPSTKESDGTPPPRGSLTFVMVKEQAGWRIASAQTTPVL